MLAGQLADLENPKLVLRIWEEDLLYRRLMGGGKAQIRVTAKVTKLGWSSKDLERLFGRRQSSV